MSRRTHVERQKWMPCINRAQATIPPYSIVQITGSEQYSDGVNSYDVATVEQANENVTANNIAITDGQAVPAGQVGNCTRSSPFVVSFVESESGTIETDDTCGPVEGEWEASPDGSGMIFHGELAGAPGKALASFTGGALGFVRCAARATESFAEEDSTLTVNNVTIEVGDSPLEDPDDTSETLEVQNRYSYSGSSGDDLTIAWRDDKEEWYLLQKGC